MSQRSSIFINYARRDGLTIARQLSIDLKTPEFDTWIDATELKAGDNWMDRIFDELARSSVLVAVITFGWLESEFAQKELQFAIQHEKRIIPVMVSEIDPEALPPTILQIQWVDLRDGDYTRALQTIRRALDSMELFAPQKAKQKRPLDQNGPAGPHSDTTASPNEHDVEPLLNGQPNRYMRAFHFFQDDRPEGTDYLGYERYAEAFEKLVRNANTEPPVTVGIYASWGGGKSFLMRRIMKRLQPADNQWWRRRRLVQWLMALCRYPKQRMQVWAGPYINAIVRAMPKRSAERSQQEQSAQPHRHRAPHILAIEFDAWIYAGSENLWASLVTCMYDAVEKYYGLIFTFLFRLRYLLRRPGVVPLLLLLAVSLAVLATTASDPLPSTISGVVAAGTFLTAAFKSVHDLILGPAKDLAARSSRNYVRDKIGFMADVKEDISLLTRALEGTQTRLVLFIDDLDRCEAQKAVEVLQALMLLLTEQQEYVGSKTGLPIIVFLGLDARVMVKAIEESYGDVLRRAGVTGYEYLDKIVQVPFRIPPPKDDKLVQYVDRLLRMGSEVTAINNLNFQQRVNEEIRDDLPITMSKNPTELQEIDAGEPDGEHWFVAEQHKAFNDFKSFLSRNPRRVKRIVNIYRLVHLLSEDVVLQNPRLLIKWIILCEQWPFRMAWILQKIEDDIQRGDGFFNFQGEGLQTVYESVKELVFSKEAESYYALDGDPELFDLFIRPPSESDENDEIHPDELTVRFIHEMRYFTFNLNPAMQAEVLKHAARHAGTL